MIVIGGVALFTLPVAQYPNVVPPTISVTTRYPGASARTVVDTVALPIEQQVNGVDGMIYMQSYSASDGSYTLTVTFRIGMDINFAQVLVQNRVVERARPIAAGGASAGRDGPAEIDGGPDVRHAHLVGPALRQPVPRQLRDHQPEGRARRGFLASATSSSSAPASTRCASGSIPTSCRRARLGTQDVVNALKGQNQQVAAGQLGMPPAPDTPALPVHARHRRPPRRRRRSSRTSSSRRHKTGR